MKITEKSRENIQTPKTLPLLPLRDLVVFPHMVLPLFVGRSKSVAALDMAISSSRLIFLATQRDATNDEPEIADIYPIGTIAEILQLLKLPDGTIKVLVEGLRRQTIRQYLPTKEYFEIETVDLPSITNVSPELTALMRSCIAQFEQYVKLHKRIPPETLLGLSNQEDPERVADIISAQMVLKVKDKQELLETRDLFKRFELLLQKLGSEIEILTIEKKIRTDVRNQMEQTQREYYLHEQMKAIQRELGKRDDDQVEIEELKQKIEAAGMPPAVKEKAERELHRLEKMSPMSAESTVSRTYLDWLVELPWSKKTEDKIEIEKASKILEEDHYGLEKPKERILEYLAVRKLSESHRGPILCFVGPSGTGKTSLGRSIARSLGRNFVRVSLGGIHDEAEIRGHRRTYVGALPGRIIQGMKKAGSINPVFLLDEIDKLAADFRGDPASALLEVLDPEQNKNFSDHYLDADYDLSQVMFITTANILHPIPRPLLDRMEVINLSGYTEYEKEKISTLFLIPKQMKEHGLSDKQVEFLPESITKILREYTREAGVRNLERSIAMVCRKTAREIVEAQEQKKKIKKIKLSSDNLIKYLGQPKFRYGQIEVNDEIGLTMGLAWTEVGGELLSIEALTMPGTGQLTLTGKLGEVMQESARAALGYSRSKTEVLNLPPLFYKKMDIHIHVPEGAIPKDGPSAGITIATSLISALSRRPVRRDIAMTGEITLRGKVLPIGGLKEKTLAAIRGGLSEIIIPKDNKRDLDEIPEHIKSKLKFHLVETMDEVINIALKKADEKKAKVNTR
ncbi:MAG: endopeptidase La [Candidatus Hydrogenedentes bacterium CG1_02_42_14]|nr:MAG: endopeptidase La [Candidatus Hydrogenedentes bacterium CG1_02_42_14]